MKQKLLLLLILMLLWSISGFAQYFAVKDKFGNELWFHIMSETEAEMVNRYGGDTDYRLKKSKYHKMSHVAVPSTVRYKGKDYKIKRLSDIDFSLSLNFQTDVSFLQEIELPDCIEDISRSFENCYMLEKIVLPQNLKKIDDSAFCGCKNLKEISIPQSVKTIGKHAFWDCWSLERLELPYGIERISKDMCYMCEKLKSINIPASVTTIEEGAFRYCSSLTDVTGLHKGIIINDYTVFYGSEMYGRWDKTFDYCVNSHIILGIKEWQKKRDFETLVQYQERVTKEKQEKKVKELLQAAIKEYTNRESNKLKVELGSYDSDYQMYKIQTNYGDKYVKVLQSEAQTFKENFANAIFNADYIATKDNPILSDLTIIINDKTYQTEKASVETASYDIELPTIDMPYPKQSIQKDMPTSVNTDLTIDQNIPANAANNTNTFAVIIGNERYTQVAQVPYANNDAKIFAEYCKKTLGLPEKNVKVYENASYGRMIGAMSDIQKIAKAFKGDINVIFYYAGHGIPDEATGDGYLLPIDADGLNMRVCYPLSQLYKELGDMQVKSVTCFMDACFSGAQRGNGMVVAARGVAIKAKADAPKGNTVVFTAATDKQTAYPYEEKGHGLFTYYLLKKLRETKGDCTLGELGAYISDEVAKQAVVTNGKEQTPVVLTSQGIANDWKDLKLR